MIFKKLILFFFLLNIFFSFSSFAIENKVQNLTSTSNFLTKDFNQAFSIILNQLNRQKYASAALALNQLLKQIKELDHDLLHTFFPEKTSHFQQADIEIPESIYSDPNLFGVVYKNRYYSQAYLNKETEELQTIDINIIFSDPSINEYWETLNGKYKFKNIQRIKVNNIYSALEKYSKDSRFCEWNILLNSEIMINIIGNGISEKSFLEELVDLINFSGLINYLSE